MQEQIDKAVDVLKSGGLIGLPTETVYGLAAAINIPQAVKKIFLLKERPFFDPLIVHVTGIEQAKEVVADWPQLAQVLAEKFWPGPLTIVLKKQLHIDSLITADLETVGVRCPAHPLAQQVISQAGVPLAAPSANKFGKTSPTAAEHVRAEFTSESVFVLDGGPCQIGVESTVLGINATEVLIYRPGMVSAEQIAQAAKGAGIEVKVSYLSSMASPGNFKEHYMPRKPLVIKKGQGQLTTGQRENISTRLGVRPEHFVELKLPQEAALAARVLYAEFRRLADQEGDYILYSVGDTLLDEQFAAIWDRLNRAASLMLF
ncbi:MAG: threonylcarbamoyl-AMP synthase [Deltaproteobacteria bacterium]|nr:threonylcarbamoyl-AMP synthase [Deltaproteobacteria bacterium]